jgi:hypothetical protein
MTGISGRKFAFIINQDGLPNPFLVEISRRTKTLPKHVEYYEPSVLYCPLTMEIILKSILDDDELFVRYRKVIKEAMVLVLHAGNTLILKSEEKLQTIAVEAVVAAEIAKCTKVRKKQKSIASICRTLRTKRLLDEAYLRLTFTEDIKRSLRELNYVLSCSR